ncbi:hypothetical protein [uncultured Martelella sp.]|nr:hypothetical protein [uncultured Martelella sp.]
MKNHPATRISFASSVVPVTTSENSSPNTAANGDEQHQGLEGI